MARLTNKEKIAARQKAEKRWKKFKSCKHRFVQEYTECCIDTCFENIYITKDDMVRHELNKIKRNKENKQDDSGW